MGALLIVVAVVGLFVGAFVLGVLFGRKNAKLVETAVTVAKDPKDALKKL